MTTKTHAQTVRGSRSPAERRPGSIRHQGRGRARIVEALGALSFSERRFALLLAEALGRITDEKQLDASEVRRHIYRVVQGAALQERRAPQARTELARTLGPSLVDVDPVPYATVEQARRLAAVRTSLLRAGAYSTAVIAHEKGITANNARQWISRNRRTGRLFTVTHEGETLVPAFLLDDRLEPKREIQPAIAALREAGEDGWALWAWFGMPSSWVGGKVPAELVTTEPEIVADAARQRAAAAA